MVKDFNPKNQHKSKSKKNLEAKWCLSIKSDFCVVAQNLNPQTP